MKPALVNASRPTRQQQLDEQFREQQQMDRDRYEFNSLSPVERVFSIAKRHEKLPKQGNVSMATVYVEARPKGRPEGSPIDDYVVEDHADHVLQTFKTQRDAIDWAKKNGHTPHVARVRHLNDKKKADHWRAV